MESSSSKEASTPPVTPPVTPPAKRRKQDVEQLCESMHHTHVEPAPPLVRSNALRGEALLKAFKQEKIDLITESIAANGDTTRRLLDKYTVYINLYEASDFV
ncbi:hypothetical protein AC249_AIPGENE28755 [Exaiptasia diaphana]|nr:hypothetical protein AC249_AIPGENE28755 [Exaiptasia diaphana]